MGLIYSLWGGILKKFMVGRTSKRNAGKKNKSLTKHWILLSTTNINTDLKVNVHYEILSGWTKSVLFNASSVICAKLLLTQQDKGLTHEKLTHPRISSSKSFLSTRDTCCRLNTLCSIVQMKCTSDGGLHSTQLSCPI